MISLDAFVGAIQDAILKANKALMDLNSTSVIEKFFEECPDDEDGSSSGGPRSGKPGSSHGDHDHDEFDDPLLHPKMVVVQYPVHTANGMQMKDVHVPLITLVPVTHSHVGKVRIATELQLHEVEGELKIEFGKARSTGGGFFGRRGKEKSPGKLEITLEPHAGAEGLQVLINGYEKALRAQIPS